MPNPIINTNRLKLGQSSGVKSLTALLGSINAPEASNNTPKKTHTQKKPHSEYGLYI